MCEFQHHLNVFLKNHWIWTIKMDFHPPFLGECNVHLPNHVTVLNPNEMISTATLMTKTITWVLEP
jgi:hypothetical protein